MSTKKPSQVQEAVPQEEEDLIVVPKGQSKLRFFLILALTIFVLLIFTVGDYFQQTFQGGGRVVEAMSWVDPQSGERHSMDARDFTYAKRSLQLMTDLGLFRPAPNPDNPRGNRVSDEDAAMWLVLGNRAKEAGIFVTDAEVAEAIGARFQRGEDFQRWSQSMRTTPAKVQEEVRRVLAHQKYKAFLKSAVSVADTERIAEMWAEQHPEYAFQYVQVDVAGYKDEALQNVPADEELQTWFHELPGVPPARALHRRPRRSRGRMARPFDRLRFDRAAREVSAARRGRARDARARLLQPVLERAFQGRRNRNRSPRGEEDAAEEPKKLFKSFEEVQAQCELEAPIHAALGEWLTDMQARAADTESETPVSLAEEAAALGLQFEAVDGPRTRTELETAAGWGGRFVAGQLAFGREASFLPRIVLESNAMVVGYVDRKVPGEEPPFADIREKIAEEWAADHAKVIATEKLEALRDSFGDRSTVAEGEDFLPSTDAETFQSVATAAGFEVVDRPYLERFGSSRWRLRQRLAGRPVHPRHSGPLRPRRGPGHGRAGQRPGRECVPRALLGRACEEHRRNETAAADDAAPAGRVDGCSRLRGDLPLRDGRPRQERLSAEPALLGYRDRGALTSRRLRADESQGLRADESLRPPN